MNAWQPGTNCGPPGRVPATAAIVHYGATAPTLKQILAVREWASEVVVVANDGTADRWFTTDPSVRWVVPVRNLGYGGAANAAFRESEQPVVALLNTDISIPPDVAREACAAVLDGKAEIVGLSMRRPSGQFLSGAGSLSRFLLIGAMREPSDRLQYCQWVTGAAMFIASECLEKTRFDERYFLGVEDADFCLRAAELGFRTAVAGAPGTVHEGGSVIGPTRWFYYSARNPIWLVRSRRGRLVSIAVACRLGVLLVRVLAADVMKRRGYARSRLMGQGIWHGLILDPAPGDPPFEWEPIEVPHR